MRKAHADAQKLMEPEDAQLLAATTGEVYSLARDVHGFLSCPKVVDITKSKKSNGRSWVSRKNLPEFQIMMESKKAQELVSRIEGFKDRLRSISDTQPSKKVYICLSRFTYYS